MAIGGQIIWNLDVDSSKFKAGLGEASAEAKAFSKSIDSNIGGGIKKAFEGAADASRQFAQGIAVAGAGLLAAGTFGLRTAGNLEAARQGFVTLLGSAQAADATMARIKKEAARTPFEITGLTNATQLLASVTKDGNKSIDVLLNVGKALAATGKGQAELDRIILNLQQIGLTGKITELDIRQFGFAGVNILELLADSYGVTTEKAVEMVKDSDDAFGDLIKAFEKAGAEGGRFGEAFINQAGTFNQLLSNVKDSLSIFAADVATQSGAFDAVKGAMASLIATFDTYKPEIINGIKDFMTFMRDNAAAVGGAIFGALVPALAAVAYNTLLITIRLAPFILLGAILFKTWNENRALFYAIVIGLAAVATVITVAMLPALVAMGIAGWAAIAPLLPLIAIATLVGLVVGGAAYLIIKNWEPIAGFFVSLVTSIAGSLTRAYNSVRTFVGNFIQSGRDIVNGIVQGIANAKDAVVNKIKEICSGALNAVKSFFGIKSPSKIMAEQGIFLMKGFAQGISSSAGLVTSSVDNMASQVMDKFSGINTAGSLSMDVSGAGGGSLASNGITINQTNNISRDVDLEAANRELGWRLAT
jgi:tape measure domain-containing protein